MECGECARLSAERESLQRICELAISNLKAAAAELDSEQLLHLKTIAEEAKTDLERVDAEIARHEKRHAVANGGV